LKNVFAPLNQHKDYVFWIRNHDMSQQIYVSAVYETIWERDESIVYEIPLIWLEYLARNNKDNSMRKMQERHVQGYQDPVKNLVLYQVEKPNQAICHLRDQCFKCEDPTENQYIVGISKNIPESIWYLQYQTHLSPLDDNDNAIYAQFFHLLEKNFAIKRIKLLDTKIATSDSLRQYLGNTQNVMFSKRELECLYHLCNGKTAKQTARDMLLSPRTVETYLENIRSKTGCSNKLAVIGRFARYFHDVSDLYTKQ
jgi:DNA-binding CsgD family transcriptional regulator